MRSVKLLSSCARRTFLPILLLACCGTITANAQTVSNNGTGTNNGFFYSLFTSSGSSTMTLGSAGNYALTWSGVGDVVGGKGFNPGSAQVIGYNVGSASGFNYISVYGWFTNPLVEYYITEFGSLFTANATELGTVTSDGHTYTTFEHQQVDQPSIEGTQTFEQYLDAWGGASFGQNGVVTTANHINHWMQLGLPIGTFNYQILATEAFNGASGSVNATVCAGSCGSGGSPSFSLSASPSSVSVKQGANASDTIAVNDSGGFTGSVTLKASGLPSGVTAAFATNPTSGTSTATFTASSSAATGSSTVTITGTSGSITKTTTIALSVTSGNSGGGCTVAYTISPQNSNQFGATVGITNGGSTTLSGWSLTWTFANGQIITSSWNGAVSQGSGNVTVSQQSGQTWENIPPGGTYTGFGFNGSWNGMTNAVPTGFKLNGTACSVN